MKIILPILCALCIQFTLVAQHSSTGVQNLLIGTYSPADKPGIYIYSFDPTTGNLEYKSETSGIENPSYLAVTKDQAHVYAVNEVGDGRAGVTAFSFDKESGKLTALNRVSSGGDASCYVSVDDKNRFVFVGNYSGGSVSAIPLHTDGSFADPIQTIQHNGKGPLKNQEKPHVHAAVLSPDNQYLFVPDLGTDKINVYRINYATQEPLIPATPAFNSVSPGNGPRHFTFHPNNKVAYLIQEMSGVVTSFDYSQGRLTQKQSVSLPPNGFSGKIDAADIHLSPDARFLYGSLRGDLNEVVIYSVDKKGLLTYVGRQSTLGKTPRNFAIDPTGNYLLVAHQSSNDIIVFKRDKQTGLLQPTGKKIQIEKPVYLQFSPAH